MDDLSFKGLESFGSLFFFAIFSTPFMNLNSKFIGGIIMTEFLSYAFIILALQTAAVFMIATIWFATRCDKRIRKLENEKPEKVEEKESV